MPKFFDRVKMSLTTTGTGTVTFGAVVSGFQSLADASVVDADVVRYTIESGTNYEVGTGTIGLAGGTYTMARSPSSSSQGDNSAINLAAGAVCFLTFLAGDVVQVIADLDNVSATTPNAGQTLAWDSGTSSWVPTSPSGGIVTASTFVTLPSSPSTTDLAFTNDTKALYIYDGTEWDRIASGTNQTPDWTTEPPTATVNLSQTGTATTQTVLAVDPENFPITYSFDTSPSNQEQATITHTAGAFTITPTTDATKPGSFTLRYKASDGLNSTARSTPYLLSFEMIITVATAQSRNSNTLAISTDGVLDAFTTNPSAHNDVNYFPDGDWNSADPSSVMPTGKRYIEFEVTTLASSGGQYTFIGMCNRSTAYNNDGASGATSIGYGHSTTSNQARYLWFYTATGDGGNLANTAFSNVVQGDVVQICYDTTAEKVWFGKNNTWASFTGDPTTGTGQDLDFSEGYAFAIAGGSSQDATIKLTSGGSVYSPPTGFLRF
tara:strand:+ start:1495 stop:2970 length:1476 start_codon:yes stop_codon:yes gene_type:complete